MTPPSGALLRPYAEADECYADCYAVDIDARVVLSDYVACFYTTWLFGLERTLLRFLASRPSTDRQVRDFATGASDRFAAWYAENRSENQLLACDFSERTRSWFMIEPVANDDEENQIGTRLYFGSAVVPRRNPKTHQLELGSVFSMLLGYHKLYSRALLSAAAARLKRQKFRHDANASTLSPHA